MSNDERMIAALLRERESCERAGRLSRVAAIDAQLTLRGHKPESTVTPVDRSTPEENKQTTAAPEQKAEGPRKRTPRKRASRPPAKD